MLPYWKILVINVYLLVHQKKNKFILRFRRVTTVQLALFFHGSTKSVEMLKIACHSVSDYSHFAQSSWDKRACVNVYKNYFF